MCFSAKKVGKINIVEMDGPRMDAKVAIKFRSQMSDLIKKGDKYFLIDFDRVTFIDSSGLGAIAASQHLLGSDGVIILCHARESLLDLFQLTRMDKMFRHFESKNAALVYLHTHENSTV